MMWPNVQTLLDREFIMFDKNVGLFGHGLVTVQKEKLWRPVLGFDEWPSHQLWRSICSSAEFCTFSEK